MSVALDFHRAHKERQARIEAAAQRLSAPVVEPASQPAPEPLPLEEPKPSEIDQWCARQKARFLSVAFPVVDDLPVVTIDQIKRAVCRHFKVSKMDLISERRTQNLTIPRFTSFYLCKELTPKSLPEIGRQHGNRDHSTILHGIRRMTELINTHEQWRRVVDEVRNKITGQAHETLSGGETTSDDASHTQDTAQLPKAQEASGEVASAGSGEENR